MKTLIHSSNKNKIKKDVYWKNNIKSLLEFQFKRLIKSPSTLFLIFGPFFLLVSVSFVTPVESLMYLILGTGILATAFFQFGNTYREWKQAKAVKYNMYFTRNNVIFVFLSFLLFSIIFILFSTIIYLFLSWLVFYVINLGNHRDIFFTNAEGSFLGYDWSFIFYIVVINIFVSLSCAYFLESITKKETTYSLAAVTYIIISIFGLNFLNTDIWYITENNENTWIRSFQMVFPHWYSNYFTLSYFHFNYSMSEALKWTNDVYYNSTLIVPWFYSSVLFTIAVFTNVFKYNLNF